ncbi:hypothetical protein [Breznakiella homolactica]|uniref:DUF4838 domain-containing protein n=1 Tax=Breznakiella homolactica TaxID=2798577 RepID=A0A7T8BAW6_9SPIR|nr:hypothetical protein [Breznakiella homolactica]QQO09440.1 hypothetical protein JFL75_00515 [Breznakiella homolactica]
MAEFDISKEWTILAPDRGLVWTAAEEISRCVQVLRKREALNLKPAEIIDGSGGAPEGDSPLIVMNHDQQDNCRSGFSWRAGKDRVEIYGDSPRGLCGGAYSFLAALGFSWPDPYTETVPQNTGAARNLYSLSSGSGFEKSENTPEHHRRLVFTRETPAKAETAWLVWARRNSVDTAVVPLYYGRIPASGIRGMGGRRQKRLCRKARDMGFTVEAGGWDLSGFVPRKNFGAKRELLRMEQGKRIKHTNFCATNPDTLEIIRKGISKLLSACPELETIHLWPDRHNETLWCACPACRAFSAGEQYLMAVSAAADAGERVNPRFTVSYYDTGETGDIQPGPNTLGLNFLPGSPEAAARGWFLADR